MLWFLQAILLLLKLLPRNTKEGLSPLFGWHSCPIDLSYFSCLEWWIILIPSYLILAKVVGLILLAGATSD